MTKLEGWWGTKRLINGLKTGIITYYIHSKTKQLIIFDKSSSSLRGHMRVKQPKVKSLTNSLTSPLLLSLFSIIQLTGLASKYLTTFFKESYSTKSVVYDSNHLQNLSQIMSPQNIHDFAHNIPTGTSEKWSPAPVVPEIFLLFSWISCNFPHYHSDDCHK